MEASYLQQGSECLAKADKKANPGMFGRVFGSRSQRMEEACDLYKQAANFFRLAKDFHASAQAFSKCAECIPEEAANYLTEAGNSIRKANSAEAVNYDNQAVDMLAKAGRLSMAARLRKQIAEIYEQDEMLELSATSYQQAAELFEMDNGESTANQCLLKVAELLTLTSLEPATVLRAIKVTTRQVYDQVGNKYLLHNLTKFSAKDLFFRVALLHLAIEVRTT